jgi:hypothetical protein
MKKFIATAVAVLLSLPSLAMAQQTASTADIVGAADAFLAGQSRTYDVPRSNK